MSSRFLLSGAGPDTPPLELLAPTDTFGLSVSCGLTGPQGASSVTPLMVDIPACQTPPLEVYADS